MLPVLQAADALFKVPARLSLLMEMNSGLPQFSQVGKFLTIYPQSTSEARRFASTLHRATRGLQGPEIPFDQRYRRNSLIYYRYGEFRRTDESDGVIHDLHGKAHPDRRAAGCAVPPWLDDPFTKAPKNRQKSRGPIGHDYLAFRVLAQRGKGGVYEAIDLSVSPARLVILKEGRPLGEIDLQQRDGFARVQNEARLLRLLRGHGLPVPEVFAEFTQAKKKYVVLEKLPGRPLLAQARPRVAKPSWPRSAKITRQLGTLLARVHAAGWVWRDCKPSHIFLHRGEMLLIDFEGACRREDTKALPWGSPPYLPPAERIAFRRAAGTLEDDYALGVIAFQLGTAELPASNLRQRAAQYRRSNCPAHLRKEVERLLGA